MPRRPKPEKEQSQAGQRQTPGGNGRDPSHVGDLRGRVAPEVRLIDSKIGTETALAEGETNDDRDQSADDRQRFRRPMPGQKEERDSSEDQTEGCLEVHSDTFLHFIYVASL